MGWFAFLRGRHADPRGEPPKRGAFRTATAWAPEAPPPKRASRLARLATSAKNAAAGSATACGQFARTAKGRYAFAALGATAAGTGLCLVLFLPHDTDARIADTRWEVTRTREHDQRYNGQEWVDRLPPRVIDGTRSCEVRTRSTFRCEPGTATAHDCHEEESCVPQAPICSQSCTGSGSTQSCTQSCVPMPDNCWTDTVCTCDENLGWCSFSYMQWTAVAARVTRGGKGVPVPSDDPAVVVAPSDPDDRMSDTLRAEVVFADGKLVIVHRTQDFADFARFTYGERWRVRWTLAGSVTPLWRLRQQTAP